MAIADTINLMKTNITNAYNAIQTKGGTIPTNKNLENLSTAINSIEAGGGIEDVATVAALQAKCTADNAGKVYRYTGTTSGNYIKGALYVVHYDDTTANYDGGSYPLFNLGLEIYKLQTAPYTITYNLTACSITSGDSTSTMDLCGSKKIIITAMADYTMPESITVAGCSYNYTLINNNYDAILELYNPTGNITVTIAAEIDFNPAAIMFWYKNKGVDGFDKCIQTWNSTQCSIWGKALGTIDSTYTQFFDMLKDPTLADIEAATKLLDKNLYDIFKAMGIEFSAKSEISEGSFWITQTMSNGTEAGTGTSVTKGVF